MKDRPTLSQQKLHREKEKTSKHTSSSLGKQTDSVATESLVAKSVKPNTNTSLLQGISTNKQSAGPPSTAPAATDVAAPKYL